MVIPHSSILASFFAAALLTVPLIAYWDQLELGERVYAIAVIYFVLPASFVYVPFRDPNDGSVHWAIAWNPPLCRDERNARIITPELVEKLRQGPIPLAPDFYRNSTTQPMRLAYIRTQGLVTMVFSMAGWFFVPGLIDRLLYSHLGPARGNRVRIRGPLRSRSKKSWRLGNDKSPNEPL